MLIISTKKWNFRRLIGSECAYDPFWINLVKLKRDKSSPSPKLAKLGLRDPGLGLTLS